MIMKMVIMASYTVLSIKTVKMKYLTNYVLLLLWGKRWGQVFFIYIYLFRDFHDIANNPTSLVFTVIHEFTQRRHDTYSCKGRGSGGHCT